MAEAGRGRLLQLPRRADQQPYPLGIPALRDRPLATNAAAPQPEGPLRVGPGRQAGGRLAPQSANPPSVAQRALCRQTPEVGAVCGKAARTVLCGGRPVMGVPTAIRHKAGHDEGVGALVHQLNPRAPDTDLPNRDSEPQVDEPSTRAANASGSSRAESLYGCLRDVQNTRGW